MPILLLLGILLFPFVLGITPGLAAPLLAEHHYLETIGDQSTPLLWQLFPGEPLCLKTRLGKENDQVLLNAQLATLSWQFDNPQTKSHFQVQRLKNLLRISGQLNGKPIERMEKIDSAPWYQTLSLSLRDFLNEKDDSRVFWILRPGSLKTYRLRAKNEGVEEIALDGQTVNAIRVEIRMTGLKAMLWKADYWFRTSDLLFLRYLGPSGLPGSPKTVVELIEE